MSPRESQPRFDLARIRAATEHGSTRFWTSLEELIDEDGFRHWLAAEFPTAASMFDDPGRRQFLKLMGASLLLAGLGGCGEIRSEQALPYVNQPEDMVPGVARRYATAVLFEGYAQPVIATTYSGRPVKLDGNPDHPVTRGKSDAFTQSALFGLYDPERSQVPLHNGGPAAWPQVDGELSGLRNRWRERRGEGLRILIGAVTSPTLLRQMHDLAALYPAMRWHIFEPIGSARQDKAMRLAFGRSLAPHYRLDRCEVIVSLDHDLLGPGPYQVMHARDWATRRGEAVPGRGRGRLHVAESLPSLTGTVASARLPCDPPRLGALVQALAAKFSLDGFTEPSLTTSERHWLDRATTELRAHHGRGLLATGPHLNPHWQALAAAINDRLGNSGETVWYGEPIARVPETDQTLDALVADMAAGNVDTLVILDSNPAYTAPGPLDFKTSLMRVPNRIHAGLYADETAALCEWHLPLSYSLEGWTDARAIDGSALIAQPVIRPLYASRSIHQVVDMMAGTVDPAADAAVRATWREIFGGDFDGRWSAALHDGFVAGSAAQPFASTPHATPPSPKSASEDASLAERAVDVVFRPDPTIWDGRFGNIAWLQELPKPLTKITWDNVIAVSPALAAAHSLSNGDVIEIAIEQRPVRGPVWIVPGQAGNTVALFFGYGRRGGGELAKANGYDAFFARPDGLAWQATGTLNRVDGHYPLATTQAHHRIDGFDLVRDVTAANPNTPAAKQPHTIYPDWNAEAEHAWGMAIDLDLCIGCNACISACNAENNVLVVGKDQVARGREMLWLRVDRYYSGDVDNPNSSFQPVPCMHCEKAPCEMGCPVHATVHSPEGVNQMVYNRCIGTRTCSSYCPYKVRRFNWYDYRPRAEAEQAAKNPDVTVRSRGVMEKCSYCTQRIQAAHVEADKEGRALHRDEVVTACQQACPTTAIVFGDLKDKESAVSKRRQSGRHYALLEELGTRPRTTYLARWNDRPDDGGAA